MDDFVFIFPQYKNLLEGMGNTEWLAAHIVFLVSR